MTGLSPLTIQNIGHEVRGEHRQITGNCRDIALSMQALIDTRYDIHLEVVEVQVGERRDTHFVNKLAASDYTADVEGAVLIDAALDQFCTENQHLDDVNVDFGPRDTLPNVALYPPGTEERCLWYYTPNDPEEGRDVFTGEKLPY